MGDSFARRLARQALAWSAIALAILVVSWTVTAGLAIVIFFALIVGLAVLGLFQACTWQSCFPTVFRLAIVLIASFVFSQFEDQIHFSLLRPLYTLELAFAKPGPEGYISRTWTWAEALNFGWGSVVYDDKPNAVVAGNTRDYNCGVTTTELGQHFYLVRKVCWS